MFDASVRTVSAECGLQVALPGPALIRRTTFTMPLPCHMIRTLTGRQDARTLLYITTVGTHVLMRVFVSAECGLQALVVVVADSAYMLQA